jgi:two-component system, chemotaxis family, response regulator Rcp1
MVREALQEHQLHADLLVKQDGEQMLKMIEQMEAGEAPCPDIVLLDLNLPRRTGFELLARMRESAACRHLPVIVVTSSAAQADRSSAQKLGAVWFFVKPSNYDDFMRLGEIIRHVTDAGSPNA